MSADDRELIDVRHMGTMTANHAHAVTRADRDAAELASLRAEVERLRTACTGWLDEGVRLLGERDLAYRALQGVSESGVRLKREVERLTAERDAARAELAKLKVGIRELAEFYGAGDHHDTDIDSGMAAGIECVVDLLDGGDIEEVDP